MIKIKNKILSNWRRKVMRMHNSYFVSLPVSWVRANELTDKECYVKLELREDGKVEISK